MDLPNRVVLSLLNRLAPFVRDSQTELRFQNGLFMLQGFEHMNLLLFVDEKKRHQAATTNGCQIVV